MNDDPESRQFAADLRRRELLKASVATGGAMAAAPLLSAAAPAQAKAARPPPTPVPVVLRVNGAEHEVSLDPRTTLLDALREHLQLTGSKKGCGLGQCGACTVLIDGKRMKSCLSLAVLAQGRAITTIGGVGTKPWRLPQVEAALVGSSLAPDALRRAASLAAQGAKGWGHNDFKIELMQRAIVRAVETAGAVA
jgi:hypothetical protein